MSTGTDERNEKLTAALEPLGRGETAAGEPIDLAKIAAETHAKARAFARKIAVGQARTAHKMRSRRFRG